MTAAFAVRGLRKQLHQELLYEDLSFEVERRTRKNHVLTEMFIGSTSGLGRRIIDFQLVYDVKSMYATILLTGLVGYLLNLAFLYFEKRFLFWSGK